MNPIHRPAATMVVHSSNDAPPASLAAQSTTELSVVVDGATIGASSVSVTAASPGIFTTTGVNGQAAAINQDGSLNSASNPAARGSVVSLYATGQGSGTANNVNVTIDGYDAAVQYAGAAPDYPGLMQINAQIPSGVLQPGTQPVLLSIDGVASQAGVTLSLY